MLLRIIWLIAFLMIGFAPYIYAQTEKVFYYYQSRQYYVALSYNQLVVGYKDALSGAGRKNALAITAGISADSILQDGLKGRYILKLNKSMLRSASQGIMARLKKDASIAFVRPAIISNAGKTVSYGDEFVVKLKPGRTENDLNSLLSKFNCRMARPYPFAKKIFVLTAGAGNDFDALKMADIFFETGLFEYAEPDFTLHDGFFDTPPSDPLYPLQWAHKNTGSPEQYNGVPGTDMKIEEAWTITKGSSDVVIAVIDSGVDTSHVDLKDNLVQGFDCVKLSSGPGDGIPLGYSAHGTCCAGIIAAVADNGEGMAGIAPGCKIMPINVADWNDRWTSLSNIAAGFDYAWQNGVSVISNSWGGSIPTSVLDDAIHRAVTLGRNGKGSMVLFATGNNDGGLSYPASLPDVISVGGISMCGERKSLTSCDGENWGANYGAGLDVVAPAVRNPTTDIAGQYGYSTGDYYELFAGTSSACPNAAGVAALILSANNTLTAAAARMIMENNCDKNPSYRFNYTAGNPNGAWNNELGYGLVNAYKSIRAAQNGRYCNVSIAPASYTTICAGSTTKIEVVQPTGNAVYQWRLNGSNITTGPFVVASSAGQYDVLATYANSCVAFSALVTIKVKTNTGGLLADAGKTVSICADGEGARIGGAPAAKNGVQFIAEKRAFGIDLISRNFIRFSLTDPGSYDTIAQNALTDLETYSEYYFTGGDFTPLGYYALSRRASILARLDTATGARSVVATIYPEAGEWSGLAWDPVGKQLYAIASFFGGSRFYKVDLETGSIVPDIAISLGEIKWITFNKAGSLYALNRNNLIHIDKETGSYNAIGSTVGVDITSYQGGSFDPLTDSLYMTAYWQPWNSVASQDLRLVDTLTGKTTVIGTNGLFQKIDALAIAEGNYQYAWSPAAGLSNAADANPIANPATTTTYTLTVTDLCGNTATNNVQVIANAPKPSIRITATKDSICLGEMVRLSATIGNNYYYQWFFNNKKIAGATDTFLIAQRSGNYQVSVTNGRGGCFNMSSVFIVRDCSIKLGSNKPDTTCYSYFYPRLGYRDTAFKPDEAWTKTIYPVVKGNMIGITFSNFKMNAFSDTLFVYDGADEFAPVLGRFTYYQIPYFNTTYRSSAGPLTFRLITGSNDNSVGTWDAFISCNIANVYRTKQSGVFESAANWEIKSVDGSYVNASAYPSHYDDSIVISPGHTISIYNNLRLDQLWVKEGATLICNNYIDIWKGRTFDMLSEGTLQLKQGVGISGPGSVVLKGNMNGNTNQMLAPFYIQGTKPQTVANNNGRFFSLHIQNNEGVILDGKMSSDTLSLNSKSGLVSNSDLNVPELLRLEYGLIQLPVNAKLLMTSRTIVEGGNNGSFVNGAVSYTINGSNANFTARFPLGLVNRYRPLALEVQKQLFYEDNYTAQLFSQSPATPRALPAGIDGISNRYYKIERSNNVAISNATVTITYGKEDGVTDPANLRILKDDGGGNWVNIGGTGSAVDSGSIQSTVNFTSFGDFVLGNATGGYNVLPVTWLSITASLLSKNVQLKWSVANELDVHHYIVEHSTDGVQFKFISSVQVQAGNAMQKHYQSTHNLPPSGNNYYRIRQVDKDAQVNYSKTVAVQILKESGCTVTPNPTKDRVLVDCSSVISYIKCYDIQGKLMRKVRCSSAQQSISLKEFPAGRYIFKIITTGNEIFTANVLKQ